MLRFAGLLVLLLSSAPLAAAQEWRPPSREMPQMPRVRELDGEWLAARAPWFADVEGVSGVAVSTLGLAGEPTTGAEFVQIARFTHGMIPVVIWSDRNADTRADMIEIYKTGGMIIQLIDADFDGLANVVRFYDSSGGLLREERLSG